MKRIALVTCMALGMYAQVFGQWINTPEDITEEWLINGTENHYTEHVEHLKNVFTEVKVRTMLEFGCGFSTKYFMDYSDKVVSVEFVTNGTGPDWIKYCLELYRECPKWFPIVYFSGWPEDISWAPNKYMGAESVYHAAAYQPVYKESYAHIDPSFLVDLHNFVTVQTIYNPVDFAFIDAGVYIRGDLVQVCFNKVPIIAAHDIAPKSERHLNDIYGYGRIIVPDNYEEIYITKGMGTAFWVKKEAQYENLIEKLKNYANSF